MQTASHEPSLGLGGHSDPIILLIRAGFADSDRTCLFHWLLIGRTAGYAPGGGVRALIGRTARSADLRLRTADFATRMMSNCSS